MKMQEKGKIPLFFLRRFVYTKIWFLRGAGYVINDTEKNVTLFFGKCSTKEGLGEKQNISKTDSFNSDGGCAVYIQRNRRESSSRL